jgi:hypothetical protein
VGGGLGFLWGLVGFVVGGGLRGLFGSVLWRFMLMEIVMLDGGRGCGLPRILTYIVIFLN